MNIERIRGPPFERMFHILFLCANLIGLIMLLVFRYDSTVYSIVAARGGNESISVSINNFTLASFLTLKGLPKV